MNRPSILHAMLILALLVNSTSIAAGATDQRSLEELEKILDAS